jgi:hypothetical protein
MPILRRILKYTPAVVMGLLILTWVASWFAYWSVQLRFAGRDLTVGSSLSMLFLRNEATGFTDNFAPGVSVGFHPSSDWRVARLTGLGWGKLQRMQLRDIRSWIRVPIPIILSALLPLAIGPLISFRFRLWHYLAYTALVAVELAYYLRWQE